MTKEEIIKDGFFEEKEVDAFFIWLERAKRFYPQKTEEELYQFYKEMMFQNS